MNAKKSMSHLHPKNRLFGRTDVDERSYSQSESMSEGGSTTYDDDDNPYGESSYAEGYTPGFGNDEGQEYLYANDDSGGTGTVEDMEQAMSYYDQSKVDSITLNHIPPNLVRWNYATAILQFLSSGALIYLTIAFMDDDSGAARAHIFTNLPSHTNEQQQQQSIRHFELFSFAMGWYPVFILGISAINHAMVSTCCQNSYEFYISRNQNRFRWWEYSITTSLLRAMLAQLVGITDLHILLGIFFLAAINMLLLGMVHESVNAEARAFRQRPQNWSAYTLSWFPLLASWIPIVWYFVDAFLTTARTDPDLHVLILVPVMLGFDVLCPLLFWVMWSDTAPWKEYSYVNYEKGFILLSLLSKGTLAWLYVCGELLF
uniref:Uncharacterized protein n=1 Tax=Grammatophora oceanica TaxID=210454 RepID=A0A7S1UNU4_9STRA|mmetsp:Transcript_14408/g.21137  ORF Transcript_14408/g.21137 Transcript_14408/m.21137 type:complete len:373 (+) Transcript_14408:178-1296(+)